MLSELKIFAVYQPIWCFIHFNVLLIFLFLLFFCYYLFVFVTLYERKIVKSRQCCKVKMVERERETVKKNSKLSNKLQVKGGCWWDDINILVVYFSFRDKKTSSHRITSYNLKIILITRKYSLYFNWQL